MFARSCFLCTNTCGLLLLSLLLLCSAVARRDHPRYLNNVNVAEPCINSWELADEGPFLRTYSATVPSVGFIKLPLLVLAAEEGKVICSAATASATLDVEKTLDPCAPKFPDPDSAVPPVESYVVSRHRQHRNLLCAPPADTFLVAAEDAADGRLDLNGNPCKVSYSARCTAPVLSLETLNPKRLHNGADLDLVMSNNAPNYCPKDDQVVLRCQKQLAVVE